jgi:hypothetical protein
MKPRYREDMVSLEEVTLRIKFIAKVASLGKDRYVVIFPKEQTEEGKLAKGKHFKVILEEVTVDDDEENDSKSRKKQR